MTTLRPTSLQLLLVPSQTYSRIVIQLTATPSVARLDRARTMGVSYRPRCLDVTV